MGLRFPDAKYADTLLRVTKEKTHLATGFFICDPKWSKLEPDYREYKRMSRKYITNMLKYDYYAKSNYF